MFIGTGDYTVVALVALVSFVLLTILEYVICSKAKKELTKNLLFIVPGAVFAGAVVLYVTSSRFFIGILNLLTAFIVAYGVVCLLAVLAGKAMYNYEIKNAGSQRR